MVIESKDEVIYWFNQLPGATRIDILSALLHHCVPLEIRFLASRIESIARRDYSFFLEDELRANSAADMRVLCSADWLSGIAPVYMAPASPVMAPKSNVTESPFSLTDVRYKLVVSLCLLYSTNRQCATLVFDAFRKQLSVKNIKEKLEQSCQMSIASSTDHAYLTSTDLVNQSSSSPASLSTHGESVSTCSSVCPCPGSNCTTGSCDIKGINISTGVEQLKICDPKVDQSSNLTSTTTNTPTNQMSSSSCPSSSSSSSSGTINIDPTAYSPKLANISISPLSSANSSSTPIITLPPPQCGTNVTNTTLMVPSFYLNQEFVSQITLLFSLALCHPAFSFEQQSLLMVQMREVTGYLDSFLPPFARLNQLPVHHHHHHFHHHTHHVSPVDATSSVPTADAPDVDVFQEECKPLAPQYCYNCGRSGHLGNTCPEKTLDDLTKDTTFNLKLEPEAPTVNPGPDVIMARNGPHH